MAAVLLSLSVVLGLSSVADAASAPKNPGGAASGSVASISGTTMEVQSLSSGQTSVSWTAGTTFTETDVETIAAVVVGDCLMVTGTAGKKSKTTIAARTITISKPSVAGSCATQFGGAGAGAERSRFGSGGARFGSSGTRPGGGFPAGGFAGGGAGARRGFAGLANLAIVTGKVTAVEGSTVSLSGTDFSSLFKAPTVKSSKTSKTSKTSKSSKASKKPAKLAKLKTQKLKITTGKSTTWSETQSVASTAVAVGDCVSAIGSVSTTGAVTAVTVRITSTGGKTCPTGGFNGSFGGGGGFTGSVGFGG